MIFCATPYSLFTVDVAEKSIQRYSRVTGLNETGISTIHYDAANKKLVIAYANSNIDILSGSNIKNIPDIKRDNITGNKTIYNIYSSGKDYYLSTGLGVIVLNGVKNEVKDTWFIGNGGNQVRVNGFTSDGSFYYAATVEGLKKVSVSISNPADYTQWQTVSGNNGLVGGVCQNVFTIQNKVVAEKADSLFIQNGNTWQLLYTDGWPL